VNVENTAVGVCDSSRQSQVSVLLCVPKNITLFIFVITRSNVDGFYIIFGSIAAEKICHQRTYSFLVISSLCMNITE